MNVKIQRLNMNENVINSLFGCFDQCREIIHACSKAFV